MTTQRPTLCLSCRHLDVKLSDTGARKVLTCRAYPDGIPVDIQGGADHREPRGDERNGTTYDQADGTAAAMDLESWTAFTAA